MGTLSRPISGALVQEGFAIKLHLRLLSVQCAAEERKHKRYVTSIVFSTTFWLTIR